MNQDLWSIFSDQYLEFELVDFEALIAAAEPTEAFDLREPLFKKVQDVVKRANAGSAPSPSGVSYHIYEPCPQLLRRKILKVLWGRGKVPRQWRYANCLWIPKVKNSEHINCWRENLLQCVCKDKNKVLPGGQLHRHLPPEGWCSKGTRLLGTFWSHHFAPDGGQREQGLPSGAVVGRLGLNTLQSCWKCSEETSCSGRLQRTPHGL